VTAFGRVAFPGSPPIRAKKSPGRLAAKFVASRPGADNCYLASSDQLSLGVGVGVGVGVGDVDVDVDPDVAPFPTGVPLTWMLSITAMLPMEVDPLSSTMEMLWTGELIAGDAWLASNRKRVQPDGQVDEGVARLVLLVHPPTVCDFPSVVTTRKWIELVLQWMLARKSTPSSVIDMPVTF